MAIGQQQGDDTRIVLFVRLAPGHILDDLVRAMKVKLRTEASPRHVDVIVAVSDLPRTRSGKLAELAVADVVHGREVRNVAALANPEVLAAFRGIPRFRNRIRSRFTARSPRRDVSGRSREAACQRLSRPDRAVADEIELADEERRAAEADARRAQQERRYVPGTDWRAKVPGLPPGSSTSSRRTAWSARCCLGFATATTRFARSSKS